MSKGSAKHFRSCQKSEWCCFTYFWIKKIKRIVKKEVMKKQLFPYPPTYAAFALTFRKNKIEDRERTQENVGNRGTTVHTHRE